MKSGSHSHARILSALLPLIIVCLAYTGAEVTRTRAAAQSGGAKFNGRIAFVTNRNGPPGEIYSMNPDGSDQRNLTNTSTSETTPAFSPDGQKIAFVSESKSLHVMNADGSGRTAILDTRANFQYVSSPDWAPDGRRIAFAGIPVNSLDGADIYVVNADGTNLVRLTTDPADDSTPRWSPDGARIAFSSIRDRVPNEVNYEIYVMNADGSNQTRLTNNTKFDHSPAWSPDGTRIAFTSRRDDDFEIYVMNADGSNQTRLTNSPEQDSDAEWSPDGTKIIFTSSRAGRFGEIYSMNPDGTGLVNLTKADSFDMDPSWQPLAQPFVPPPTPTPSPTPTPPPTFPFWEPFIPDPQQTSVEVLNCGGTTFVKVKVTFNDTGYRIADWGQIVKSNNDFADDFKAERWVEGGAQVIITVERVYDLGSLAPGTYSFTLKSRGVLMKSRQFNVGSVAPASLNPTDDASVFVWQHYLDFLARDPDAQGFRFWTTNMLTACGTNLACQERKRIDTSAAFFMSIEFQRTGFLVHRLYRASYGRMPRREELMPDARAVSHNVVVGETGWEQLMEGNTHAFIEAWVSRPDFKFIYDNLSDAQFVDRLYANAGVTPAPPARDALVADLSAGKQTRAGVLRAIVEDSAFSRREFNPAFVLMQYFGYLQRNPDFSGFNFWLQKLNSFNGDYVRAEMVKAFLASDEYRARFCR